MIAIGNGYQSSFDINYQFIQCRLTTWLLTTDRLQTHVLILTCFLTTLGCLQISQVEKSFFNMSGLIDNIINWLQILPTNLAIILSQHPSYIQQMASNCSEKSFTDLNMFLLTTGGLLKSGKSRAFTYSQMRNCFLAEGFFFFLYIQRETCWQISAELFYSMRQQELDNYWFSLFFFINFLFFLHCSWNLL